jgi:hypothetical protein
MIVEGLVLSAAVGLITGGTASGAVASATVARVLETAPRFRALLVTLGDASSLCASRLKSAREGAVVVRARLEKFLRVEARNERGEMKLSGFAKSWERGWLRRHEVPPGHTITKHVDLTTEDLLERCRLQGLSKASTFHSEEMAEQLVGRVLRANEQGIEAWLRRGGDSKLQLDMAIPHAGTTVDRFGNVTESGGVRVVLIPNKNMDNGWQILTAFPN